MINPEQLGKSLENAISKWTDAQDNLQMTLKWHDVSQIGAINGYISREAVAKLCQQLIEPASAPLGAVRMCRRVCEVCLDRAWVGLDEGCDS